VLVCVVGLAVLYAPLALSYMWFAFEPDAPRLQDQLNELINGSAYATGTGSVMAVRTADYVDHRVVMLTHTTLGGIALVLAALQFAMAPRMGPRSHRMLGRAYLALMGASMVTALNFLMVSPAVPQPGQVAFRWQLWVLALSTVGSAWLAWASIRRGDVLAHWAWMAMNVSFMLTAPLLRVLWIALPQVFPHQDMLTTLEVGAVMLAVVAPAAGALAFVVPGSRAAGDPPVDGGGTLRWVLLVAASALGCALVVAGCPDLGPAGPAGYPWFHVAPVAGYGTICAMGAVRARHRGTASTAREWERLLVGVAWAPWAALLVGGATSLFVGWTEGYLAGLMVAPGGPIVVTFALAVAARRRSAQSPGLRAGVSPCGRLDVGDVARHSQMRRPVVPARILDP
jgi:uncharacterized membrane protein